MVYAGLDAEDNPVASEACIYVIEQITLIFSSSWAAVSADRDQCSCQYQGGVWRVELLPGSAGCHMSGGESCDFHLDS